jgi:hypothetical protein
MAEDMDTACRAPQTWQLDGPGLSMASPAWMSVGMKRSSMPSRRRTTNEPPRAWATPARTPGAAASSRSIKTWLNQSIGRPVRIVTTPPALGGVIVFALDYVWLNIEGHDNWYNQTLNNSAFFLWVLLGGIVAGAARKRDWVFGVAFPFGATVVLGIVLGTIESGGPPSYYCSNVATQPDHVCEKGGVILDP